MFLKQKKRPKKIYSVELLKTLEICRKMQTRRPRKPKGVPSNPALFPPLCSSPLPTPPPRKKKIAPRNNVNKLSKTNHKLLVPVLCCDISVKMPSATPAVCMALVLSGSISDPSCLGKAAQDGLSAWAPVTHRDVDGVLGSRLGPG